MIFIWTWGITAGLIVLSIFVKKIHIPMIVFLAFVMSFVCMGVALFTPQSSQHEVTVTAHDLERNVTTAQRGSSSQISYSFYYLSGGQQHDVVIPAGWTDTIIDPKAEGDTVTFMEMRHTNKLFFPWGVGGGTQYVIETPQPVR